MPDPAPRWTSEPPSREGWYWHREVWPCEGGPRVVEEAHIAHVGQLAPTGWGVPPGLYVLGLLGRPYTPAEYGGEWWPVPIAEPPEGA